MTDSTTNKSVRQGRIKLIVLIGIFIAPLIAASLIHRHYQAGGEYSTVSNGELINPAVPLSAFSLQTGAGEAVNLEWLKSKWTMLYFAPANCSSACQQNIYHLRQIHISLGKRAHRVQRLVVARNLTSVQDFIGEEYPELTLVQADDRNLQQQVETAIAAMPLQSDGYFLVDPLGNLMMRFAADLNPKGVIKDIKRLLRASRIG